MKDQDMAETLNAENNQAPKATYLKDYKRPPYLVKKVHFTFDLKESATKVENTMDMERHPSYASLLKKEERTEDFPLELNGDKSVLLRKVFLNGRELSKDGGDFDLSESGNLLTISGKLLGELENPEKFKLTVENVINPKENQALEGLYLSDGIFCTQNEPHGMRRITFFTDRPDVLCAFETKVIGDKTKNPILLANGNLVESGELESGRHFSVWENPHPMPCYLFALVAGDLALLEDSFTTSSGREVALKLYTEHGKQDRLPIAMNSLKAAMKWDEDRFGLEYDLDIYMIVAVESFNMGAMENKGLNIFNSACVLANPETATDRDYHTIMSVVGHEYFHNWTGNRVTCRDWFQLTLKEGLTVFRDQEFSMDLLSREIKRLEDVIVLKNFQFMEDQGPLAHSIRPLKYIEMNNFYSHTVYEKGAEIIRMIQTKVGQKNFAKGMEKYFELYDGQAVTTEDFIAAFERALDLDLTQFRRWYDQIGTHKVSASSFWDQSSTTLKLTLEQMDLKFNEGVEGGALTFPFKFALFERNTGQLLSEEMVDVTEMKQAFSVTVPGATQAPVISLNRDFSAPLNLSFERPLEEYTFLVKHEPNLYVKWESLESLFKAYLHAATDDKKTFVTEEIVKCYGALLALDVDPYDKSFLLAFPQWKDLALNEKNIDPMSWDEALRDLHTKVAKVHHSAWLILVRTHTSRDDSFEKEDVASRSIVNRALSYLKNTPEGKEVLLEHAAKETNMTLQYQALYLLRDDDTEESQSLRQRFYQRWENDKLVICKWLQLFGLSDRSNVLGRIKSVMKNSCFDPKVPNMLRALVRSFARSNARFHTAEGYEFLREVVLEVDAYNPQMSAGLLAHFEIMPHLKLELQNLMKAELQVALDNPTLSNNAKEILEKIMS